MKKYIWAVIFTAFILFGIGFVNCTEQDEAVFFGGYYYYIENGDIYRTPTTYLASETELFRCDSISISIEGTDLVSLSSNGTINIYSLITDDDHIFDTLEFKSLSTDDLLLGSLSAKYESNGNPAAISKGNDAGGVSFGAYQFASKAGVPKAFADWCVSSGVSENIGNRLLAAYKNDGSAYGESFTAEWLAIANEDPEHFLSVQHQYVKEKYYDAIVSRIEKNVPGFDMDIYGIALRNVFWSRSVQHGVGGSYNVITRAFDSIGGFSMQSEEELIKAIYAESGAVVDSGTYPMTGSTAESLGIAGKYMKYFSKNSSSVQISVYKRLNINELALALEMLKKYGGYEPPIGIDYEFANFFSSEITENSAKISATLYNYKGFNISEYGFFMGKSMNSLIDHPLFVGSTSVSSINLTKKFTDSLESNTVYYYGAYAFIDGDYITSDIFTFETLEEIKYNVKYLDHDGSLLYEAAVSKGCDSVYNGSIPFRKSNAQYSYTFIGWDMDGKNITSDTVIKAKYKEKDHLWSGNISYSFAEGDGTSASPYIISTPEELAYLSYIVSNGFKTSDKYFELSDNIVLGFGSISKNFSPIGTETNPFAGFFDGNGYKIIGITSSHGKFSGLFGVICGAKISSLIIEDANIKGEISGILAGKAVNTEQCIISDCSLSGIVSGNNFSGGIVGYCSGNALFENVFFSGKVDSDVCGGLLGFCNDSQIKNSFCITETTGEINDAICAVFTESARFYNCFYSDNDISNVGTPLDQEQMKKNNNYTDFDFIEKWYIFNDHATLNITKENTFEYYKYGDTNGDGIINIVDAVFFAQYLAAWNLPLPKNFKDSADVSSDGRVNIKDMILLIQYLSEWNVSLTK